MGLEKFKTLNDVEHGSHESALFFENQIVIEWLSTFEAAKYLSISENALRICVHRGQIEAHKFGRRLRFRLSDLKRALKGA